MNRYPQWSLFDTSLYRWNNRGSAAVPVQTHKRLYHNQYVMDGLSGVILWQNAGTSGGGPTPPDTGTMEYLYFSRHKHRR